MSAIENVLWDGCRALEPGVSRFGGILANKPGYHNRRDRLPNTDYSVRSSVDQQGPANKGSALDWTFSDAQSGKYGTIERYTKRLLNAAKQADPRLYALREFCGNIEGRVSGYDLLRSVPISTWDKTHLWHLHLSIHRKYINDENAMRAILSVLRGEPLVDENVTITLTLPALKAGHENRAMVRTAQGLLCARDHATDIDAEFGNDTTKKTKELQARFNLPETGVWDGPTWLAAIRLIKGK